MNFEHVTLIGVDGFNLRSTHGGGLNSLVWPFGDGVVDSVLFGINFKSASSICGFGLSFRSTAGASDCNKNDDVNKYIICLETEAINAN